MYFPRATIDRVEEIARFTYISRDHCAAWNKSRRESDLRLLSGWAWSARNGSSYRQGFKSYSAAVRDAHYALIEHTAAPYSRRTQLRLVAA